MRAQAFLGEIHISISFLSDLHKIHVYAIHSLSSYIALLNVLSLFACWLSLYEGCERVLDLFFVVLSFTSLKEIFKHNCTIHLFRLICCFIKILAYMNMSHVIFITFIKLSL